MNRNFTLIDGYTIPSVGLGTFRIEDNDEAARIVTRAIDEGYRHIDTAVIYGNEEGVGRGIQNSPIPREEIFLTTKIWNDDLRSGDIEGAFQASLERLGTDYVDLLLVHWPVGDYREYWKAFESLKEEGRAKSIGVSNFNIRMLEDLLSVARILPAVNQVELHPYYPQTSLAQFCQSRGIVLTAWSGFMVGEALKKTEIREMAEKYDRTPAQIIQRWNYQNGVVTIPKSAKPERMRENLAIFDFDISLDDMRRLDSLDQGLRKGPDPEQIDF